MYKQQSNQALVVFNHQDEAVDLSSRLSPNIIKNHNKRKVCTYEDDGQENSIRVKKIKKFRFYTREEEAQEKFNDICTKLKLYNDPWKIKKVLEKSDVNSLCRLMISKRLVKQYIVKEWERDGRFEDVRGLDDKNGVLVKVWDCDRNKEYVLIMKKHSSSDCYAFCTNWRRQFMSERELKKGDEIGLLWCKYSGRLFFYVLTHNPDQPVYLLQGF